MAEEDMMGERPPMPDMAPPMPEMAQQPMPEMAMPPEAVQTLMQPSEEMQAVLLARISNMDPQELQMLDSAITPEVANVLMKLLPELGEIINQIGGQAEPEMGALGSI
jgi:hypothetical protein